MNIDKRTLSWMNKSHKWVKRTSPYYKNRIGVGQSENAILPDTNKPTLLVRYIGGVSIRFISDGWGIEKWQHSPHLADNDCICPKCQRTGNEWDYITEDAMIHLALEYKKGNLRLDNIYEDWIVDGIKKYVDEVDKDGQ